MSHKRMVTMALALMFSLTSLLALSGTDQIKTHAVQASSPDGAGSARYTSQLSDPVPVLETTSITATVAYTITDLGDLGAFSPRAINGKGEVLGFDFPEDKLWLPKPAYGLPAGLNDLPFQNTQLIGFNDHGQLAGTMYDPSVNCDDDHLAVVWHWDEANQQWGLNTLPTTGVWDLSRAAAINNFGTVVGRVQDECSDEESQGRRAAVWQNGSLSVLGILGGDRSQAAAINEVGQIAGNSETAGAGNPLHAVLWNGGTMTDLGTLPGDLESIAVDINDEGQVIGSSGGKPFLWLPAPAYGLLAGMHSLPDFDFDPSPGQVYGINNQGQVVGYVNVAGGQQNAYLWNQGTPYDLNDLIDPAFGWDLIQATGINENGQIVGIGNLDGQGRAFLLTPVSSWTVMFYLDGDNNLSATYPPILNQLEAAADNPAVNLLVLWDGPTIADSAYIEVQHDTDLNSSANYIEGENYWSQSELDMSVKNTLTNFLSWGMSNYPADHYALILDDHGSGLGGGLVDDNSGFKMDLKEMQEAFLDTPQLFNQKLDVLYMAMCLMGMVEDAYQFRDYADFYVASEDLQWSFSEPYNDYIANISAGDSGADVAANFAASYAGVAASSGKPFTISAADMSQLDTLVAATDLLADALTAEMNAISSNLTTVHGAVQRFDNELPTGIDLQDTYIDLYDFAELVSVALPGYPDIVDAAQAVMDAIDAYVIYESHASTQQVDLDGSQGVSIFFPAGASSFYNDGNYDFAAGANWPTAAGSTLDLTGISGGWGAMLVSYFDATQPGGPDDPTPPEPLPKLDPFSDQGFLPVIRTD